MSYSRPHNNDNSESKEHNPDDNILNQPLSDDAMSEITIRYLSDPNRPSMRVISEEEKKRVVFVISAQAAVKVATGVKNKALDEEEKAKKNQKKRKQKTALAKQKAEAAEQNAAAAKQALAEEVQRAAQAEKAAKKEVRIAMERIAQAERALAEAVREAEDARKSGNAKAEAAQLAEAGAKDALRIARENTERANQNALQTKQDAEEAIKAAEERVSEKTKAAEEARIAQANAEQAQKDAEELTAKAEKAEKDAEDLLTQAKSELKTAFQQAREAIQKVIEAEQNAEARRAEEADRRIEEGSLNRVPNGYAPLAGGDELPLPLAPNPEPGRPQSLANRLLYDNKLGLKLWPFVFYGLLIHDVIEYYDKPNERFGNTLSNIFLGLPLALPKELGYAKTNQLTYLNHMGSDDVNEILAYWGYMGAVFITPILTIAIQKVVLKFYGGQAAHRDDETTRRKLSQYLLIALSGYAYERYIELVLQKGAENYYYYQEKAQCEINRKIYSYITAIADYACSICGDWEDVKVQVNAMNDPQSCLNALLAEARDPEVILEHLDKLKKYAITEVVDLSKQDLSVWSDQIFDQVLNQFSSSNLGLQVFKTSSDQQTLPISAAKLSSISRFIKTHKVVTFDGTNMFIGPDNSQILMSGLNNTYTKNVLLGNINLENKGADSLASIFSFTQSQKVEIPNNKINDLGIETTIKKMSSYTTSINYGKNPLTGESFVSIIESARKNNQTELGLSSLEDISSESIQDAFEELGIPKSITDIDISDNNWGENQIVTFSPYLLTSQLEVIIASGNDFSSNDSADVFFNSLPMTLKVLDVSKTQLTEYGTAQLKLFLEHSSITTLIISDNNFTLTGFKNILDGVSVSNVTHLDISKCQLTDDYVDILIDFLDTHKGQLISINLETNQLTDACSTRLINAFNSHGINKFNINDNLFTNKVCFAIADNLSNSTFTSASISKNKVDGDCIVSIVAAAADGPLEELIADDILTLGTDNENSILQNLVRSDYDLSYLANDQLNKDEKRALARATNNTNIKYLSLMNAGISPAGQYKFFLISSPAGFTSGNLRVSDQNSLVNSQVNSTPLLLNQINYPDFNANPLRVNSTYGPLLDSANTDKIIVQLSGAAILIFLLYQIISKSYSSCSRNRNTLFARCSKALNSNDEENQLAPSSNNNKI